MMAPVARDLIRGARIGLFVGLGLAILLSVIGAIASTEFNKSIGYSLLFLGFPTLFAVVPALGWLGLEGGRLAGVAAMMVTLSVNGILWGALTGALMSATRLVSALRH